jgi:hypothetical protein
MEWQEEGRRGRSTPSPPLPVAQSPVRFKPGTAHQDRKRRRTGFRQRFPSASFEVVLSFRARLTCISHRLSAASSDTSAPAALRSVGLLDVSLDRGYSGDLCFGASAE